MKHQESSFTGRRSLKIYFQSWQPAKARASVVIVHGLGEHSGRYVHVASELVDAGCAVYAIDLRGHGQSGGSRAMVDRFSNAIDDINQLIDLVREKQPQKPLFLLGHSMGGALSLRYALTHQNKISALILSGPAVALDGAPPLFKPLSKLLSSFLPRLGTFPIKPELVSRDPDMVAAYAQDPLNCHGKVPLRTLAEIVRFVDWLPTRLKKLKLPILLMHGSEDKLAGVSGSRMVIDSISSNDKTLRVYDGLYHEIFNELPEARAKVLKELGTWIDQRIAA
jgi:acylglycerol lipase